MKKAVFVFFVIIVSLLAIAVAAIFLTSQSIPEEAHAIIDEVLQREVPQQILGDTGAVITQDGTKIWYESIEPKGPSKGTLLLIMGLGGNAIEWPLFFIRPLLDSGYHVVRFDNRGTGLSGWPDEDFDLKDMAGDAIAVMEALGLESAHIFGMSMGGMIGQILAIENPGRVQSLTLFMSSADTQDPELPQVSRLKYISLITTGIRYGFHRTEKNIVRTTIGVRNVLTPYLSPTRIRTLAEQSLYNQRYRKGFNSRAFVQHTNAVRNAAPRYEGLRQFNIPTLVIHGKNDPLIPYEHAVKAAEVIPGAELLILEGMGHDVSPEHTLWIHQALINMIKSIDNYQ